MTASSTNVPTSKAVAAYVSAALTSVLTYKGTIGSSGATVTSLPASHKVGDTYVVSTAGTYAGKACEVGDYIICKTAGTSASDSHWDVVNGENQVENKSASLAGAGSSATIATVDGTNLTITTPSTWTGVAKTGTVTSVATGAGLTGGTITGSGTIKVKLKDETANSADSSKSTSGDGGLYSVEVDKSGNLAVRVPWTDHTYTVNNGTLNLQANGTTKTTFTANQSGNSTFNIATGSGDGTISVGGVDVSVKGLGSAAYTNSTAYAPASHSHNYIEAKGTYTFTSSTLPNSFDLGVSAGFVKDDSGFGSFGSVLTVRTFSGGGGSFQLYAPYSETYGGTHLKARFGNYASSSGNSWTSLKTVAWTEDIPTIYDWAKASTKPSYTFSEIGAGNAILGDGSAYMAFRTNSSYESGMYYSTPGNEAMVFANKYNVTSWIFANTSPSGKAAWTGLTPALQIKNQRVAINKLIATGSDGAYNLDVNGTANATTIYENGTSLADKYQPKGSYASSSHTHNYAGSDSAGGPANVVKGAYTANGGQQNPNYFGTNRVGFLMMNTTVNSNSEYKDWIIMDCYSGNDVGGGVALGVNRQSLGAYIMRSAAARTSWAESAELLGTHNYSNYAATKGHTHTTSIATSSGTNQITLAYGTKYAITAGGTSYIFTMPSSDNTWRPIGTGASDAAAGNHTHSTSIAASSATNQITLAFGTKYAITAGGTSYVFTMPGNPNTNTWRPIQVGGVDKLTDSETKINFTNSGSASVSYSGGTITIGCSAAANATADSALTAAEVEALLV